MLYENLSRRELIEKLKVKDEEIEKIKEIASLDVLTKVLNRNSGIERFNEVYRGGIENNEDISICFIDIDNLKVINDNFGHEYGDDALINATISMKNNIRKKDFIFRYGGDEFVIVFPKTSKEDANNILLRICNAIKEGNSKRKYQLSLSYGLCDYNEYDGCDINFMDLVVNADEKMYQNKNKNKNIKRIFYEDI